MSETKNIAILGSTGSIGRQALEVIASQPSLRVVALTAQRNVALLAEQARAFRPDFVVIGDENEYKPLRDALSGTGVNVLAGKPALIDIVALPSVDVVLTALVGFAGLRPTLNAIAHKKEIALANKETLVVAGSIVTALARENGVSILPVDSEHSALFQCLVGEPHGTVEKVWLTASGGPFRGWTADALKAVTREQALKHPNWSMGAKITIDSATMMNKGLEVIEAQWLFGLSPEQIDIIVHPQSIIHSMVQFQDGSMKAQMGLPDMRLPIQYALCWPHRPVNAFPRYDFSSQATLHFEPVDRSVFRCVDLAYHAMGKGGNLPCALNAANEETVRLFLEGAIGFTAIAELNERAIERVPYIAQPTLDDLFFTDAAARQWVSENVASLQS